MYVGRRSAEIAMGQICAIRLQLNTSLSLQKCQSYNLSLYTYIKTFLYMYMYIGRRTAEIVMGQLCATRLQLNTSLSLQKYRSYNGREIPTRCGVSCISFDREGVLLAAGGSNGLVQICL
jgi:hypothetical protein